MSYELDRATYGALYGPTKGDVLRLADSDLWLLVEDDHVSYGDEVLCGFGKSLREGMLNTGRGSRASELDMLISNVIVLDPVLGVVKTNIGVKDGRIVGVGRAGNDDIVDDVDLIIGPHTSIVPSEGLIATPGGVDSHVHLSTTGVIPAALSAGITTIVGMGAGGIWDVGVNPAYHLHRMIEAWQQIPINVAFLARGGMEPGVLERSLVSGASGFKVHEDFGAYPRVIDVTLQVAEQADVAVALHTDSLNESGCLADSLDAVAGRTVHAYHVEGSGGGHIPNILEIVSFDHILPSSTTPTIPYTINTADELLQMTMTVHRQNPLLATDVEASKARIRHSTIQAENVLQDQGAISIINSDSQGMGRIAETIRRTWQLASAAKVREEPGSRAGDNRRILRYLAKYTINPARAHGLAHLVGSLEPGKLADIVLWKPSYFGTKPEMTIKSGFVVWGVAGEGSGSTRLGQPRVYKPYFGSMGAASSKLAVVFVSKWAIEDRLLDRAGRNAQFASVTGTRKLHRSDMLLNAATPQVRVDDETGAVTIDGKSVRLEPLSNVALNRLYHFA